MAFLEFSIYLLIVYHIGGKKNPKNDFGVFGKLVPMGAGAIRNKRVAADQIGKELRCVIRDKSSDAKGKVKISNEGDGHF